MSTNAPKNPFADDVAICPQCGAGVNPGTAKCWLCHAPLPKDEIVTAELAHKRPPSKLTERFFLGLSVACVGLIALLGIGIAQDTPGLLIPYVLLILPPIAATTIRLFRRQQRGESLSFVDTFSTFILSTAITMGVIGLLVFATIAALFLYCLFLCSQM